MSNENILIKRVLKSEWQVYKQLRMNALKGEPDAYGTTYEDASLRSEDQWQEQVAKLASSDAAINFIAYVDEQPAGMISCYIKDKADMVQMWVEPSGRGKNIGTKLVTNLTSWLKDKQHKELHAVVYNDNLPAIQFYLKLGFIELNTSDREIHLMYTL